MSSREERSGRVTGSEASKPSGGRRTPESGSGPLFDPLDAPLPSQSREEPSRSSAGEDPVSRGERTEAMSRTQRSAARPPEGRKRPPARQGVRKRAGLRRVRRTIRHVDPFSVLKLSAFFYAIFVLVWLAFVAVIYSFLDSVGLFNMLEDLGQGLVLWEEVTITLGVVEKWALLIGLVLAVLGTLINVIIAILYNVAANLMGGIELTFVERDQ